MHSPIHDLDPGICASRLFQELGKESQRVRSSIVHAGSVAGVLEVVTPMHTPKARMEVGARWAGCRWHQWRCRGGMWGWGWRLRWLSVSVASSAVGTESIVGYF